MYERWQKYTLERAINTRRVVLLSGARQSGKTTLAKAITSGNISYRTLDDVTLLQAARNDPQSFVEHDSQMLIIDKIQHAPELLLAIKKVVDQDNRTGQYLLTGSSNIQSLPTVKESLAGRISTIRLRTLTQGEILGARPGFLEAAFNQSFNEKTTALQSQTEILEIAFRGGFPEVLRLDKKDHKAWHKDYIEALLTRDLKDLANIKNLHSMQDLIKVLAAWSSKFMDISTIGSSLAITRTTVESYINALEMLYLVERVPAWAKTDYARVGKQSKLFMTDSGLMASILGWNIDDVRFNSDRIGKIFETLVFNELAAQIDASDTGYTLYHYRDREKREIDFLVEREDSALLGIEVKSASVVYSKNFNHLRWFAENMARDKSFIGIIIYSGENFVSFGKNMFAVPISFFWENTTRDT